MKNWLCRSNKIFRASIIRVALGICVGILALSGAVNDVRADTCDDTCPLVKEPGITKIDGGNTEPVYCCCLQMEDGQPMQSSPVGDCPVEAE